MYDIIHCCVAGMSPLAPSTAETMGGKVVDLSSAMNALVWSAQRSAKSEANSHPGSLIIQPQSQDTVKCTPNTL